MTDEKTGEEAAAPALPVDSEKTIALKEKIKAAFALFDKEAKGCVVQEEYVLKKNSSTTVTYFLCFPSSNFLFFLFLFHFLCSFAIVVFFWPIQYSIVWMNCNHLIVISFFF